MAINEVVVSTTATMLAGAASNTLVTNSTDTTGATAAILHVSHWGNLLADGDYGWTSNIGTPTFSLPLIKQQYTDIAGLIFLAYGFTGGSGHQFTCTFAASATREFVKGGLVGLSVSGGGSIGASSLEASCSSSGDAGSSPTLIDAGTLSTAVPTYMLHLQANHGGGVIVDNASSGFTTKDNTTGGHGIQCRNDVAGTYNPECNIQLSFAYVTLAVAIKEGAAPPLPVPNYLGRRFFWQGGARRNR